jgi:hypothetical protein
MRAPRLVCGILLLAGAALGWGGRAHGIINRVAVRMLPEDGPAFLKAYEEWIAQRAGVPDTWRQISEPFLKIEEDPNHGWFREQFSFLKEIPRSRYEFVLAVYDEYLRIKDKDPARARLTNVRWTGTLPYAAMESYERLKSGMRLYRAQKAAGKDTHFIELDLAFYMGWLGHYVGDGAMPLHDSIHSEGWKGPNPRGYTTSSTIHGRFESAFVELIAAEPGDVGPLVGKPVCLADPFEAILQHLDRSTSLVEEVYRMDQRGAFADKTDEAARKLVYGQLAAAAGLLRDLTYTAWVESAKEPERPPKPIGATGLQHSGNPESLDNPRYNPATGSAPAPRPR